MTRVVSPSASGACMSCMLGAVINDVYFRRFKCSELLPDQISRIAHWIYAGITFLKGFTVTFANTPEVA